MLGTKLMSTNALLLGASESNADNKTLLTLQLYASESNAGDKTHLNLYSPTKYFLHQNQMLLTKLISTYTLLLYASEYNARDKTNLLPSWYMHQILMPVIKILRNWQVSWCFCKYQINRKSFMQRQILSPTYPKTESIYRTVVLGVMKCLRPKCHHWSNNHAILVVKWPFSARSQKSSQMFSIMAPYWEWPL